MGRLIKHLHDERFSEAYEMRAEIEKDRSISPMEQHSSLWTSLWRVVWPARIRAIDHSEVMKHKRGRPVKCTPEMVNYSETSTFLDATLSDEKMTIMMARYCPTHQYRKTRKTDQVQRNGFREEPMKISNRPGRAKSLCDHHRDWDQFDKIEGICHVH